MKNFYKRLDYEVKLRKQQFSTVLEKIHLSTPSARVDYHYDLWALFKTTECGMYAWTLQWKKNVQICIMQFILDFWKYVTQKAI